MQPGIKLASMRFLLPDTPVRRKSTKRKKFE